MDGWLVRVRRRGSRGGGWAALVMIAVVVSACATAQAAPGLEGPRAAATPQPAATQPASATASPTATEVPLRALKVAPESGVVGDSFTVTADGLQAGKAVEFVWMTWEGSYETQASSENVEFHDRHYEEKAVSLGQATADSTGKASLRVTTPEDFGQVHDIYALVDGQKVARGGYRIARNATISATEGPVGAPITITITGLGMKPYETLAAITYDNRYTGFASGVTNKGTAIFQIRAAGPVGRHVVRAIGSSHASPYLNVPQSPLAGVLSDFAWVYTVTSDQGAPPDTLDWPDPNRVAPLSSLASRTSASGVQPAPGVTANVEPGAGPVLSKATVTARGLPPAGEIDLLWVTSRGNRVSPSGWSLSETQLGHVTVGQDGALEASVQVPDDLGGWHVIKLVQAGKVLAEVPFRVEASLLGVSPKRVKAGETFTVHLKGVGWTELDNAFAVTYDDGYTGYACGFNSNGDIQLTLIATGAPGTHLIDLYPMLYQGHGKPPWAYQMPMLTYARDHPGLALGYRLPAVRAAIEIVE